MKSKDLGFLAGVLSLLGGLFAWFNPFAATLAAEWLAGWFFLLGGITTVVFALTGARGGARWAAVLLGIMLALIGLFLLFNPLQGAVSLTLIIAVLLLVAGFGRVLMAFAVRGNPRWILLVSGLISLTLAVMIFMNFPQSAAVILGVFLAVELISNGISLLVYAFSGTGNPGAPATV